MSVTDDLNKRWEYLIEKYTTNTCSRDELEELLHLVENEPNKESLVNALKDYWQQLSEQDPAHPADTDTRFALLMQQAKTEAFPIPVINIRKQRKRKFQYIAAAILLLAFPASIYFLYKKSPATSISAVQPRQMLTNDAAPGQNKAVLTLANGAKIFLDSAHEGAVAQQGNTKILQSNGLLSYESTGKGSSALFNTVATPKGGQYQLMLSDGSKVWLNAASSLRFPAVFTGKTREVELFGEAYFEVAKNAKMPFKVHLNGMEVEVLGTHFNINAYDDEVSTRATLLEGSIKINRDHSSDILQPGQQAQAGKAGKLKIVNDADVEEAVAWKDGNFQFDRSDIYEVMRQLKRWYDVDVDYNGTISSHFVGMISRNVNLSQVLNMLQNTGKVKFEVKGRKIVVSD